MGGGGGSYLEWNEGVSESGGSGRTSGGCRRVRGTSGGRRVRGVRKD